MGQAASDPIGSARQLKDQDLAALWKTQIGPDGRMAANVCNARDQDGRSALHIAAAEGKSQAVEILLKSQAIPANCADNNMITPLHSAVFRNYAQVASLLLANGAEINAQDLQGLTALHWSVVNASLDCIDVLLERKADATIKNLRGQTALDIARTLKPRVREQVLAKLSYDGPVKPNLNQQVVVNEKTAYEHELARQRLFAGLVISMGKETRRLLALCQLWGLVKYTHPYMAYRMIKWDEELMEATSICADPSSTNKQFLSTMLKLVGKLNDPNTRILYGDKLLTPDVVAADSSEIKTPTSGTPVIPTLSITTENGLSSPHPTSASSVRGAYPRVALSDNKLALVDCTDFEGCHETTLATLVQSFASLHTSSEGIIFDVRCIASGSQTAAQIAKSKKTAQFGIFFQEAFRTFLHDPIVLPMMRQRMYQGLPEHVKMASTGPNLFEHGFLVSDATVLHPLLAPTTPAKRRPYSFIVDKYTPIEIITIAMALQARSQACIVVQAEKNDSWISGEQCLVWEPGIVCTEFKLSEVVEGPNKAAYGDIVVQIRQNERVSPDATVGLRPDQLVQIGNGQLGIRNPQIHAVWPPISQQTQQSPMTIVSKFSQQNPTNDAGIELALRFCYGQMPKKEAVRQAMFPIKNLELEYKEADLPNRNQRFLALCRLWNAIRFFYPYKHLLQYPWDFAFMKTLNSFLSADTPVRYSLAIAECVALLTDAHAYVRSPHLGYLVGTHVPSIRVKQIDNVTVVTHVAAIAGTATSSDSPSNKSASSSSSSGISPRHPPILSLTSVVQSSGSPTADLATSSSTASSSSGSPATTSTTPRGSSSMHIVVKHAPKDSPSAAVVDPSALLTTATSPTATSTHSTSPSHLVQHPLVQTPPQLGVQVGDILVAVDGIPVEERREFLASLFSLSSKQAKKWRTDMKLLAGAEGSMAKLTLKRPVSRVLDILTQPSGKGLQQHTPQYADIVVEVPRYVASQMTVPRSGPVVNILEIPDVSGRKIGYLDLTRLPVPDVEAALAQLFVPQVGSLILDLRGFTRGTIFRIAPHFATHVTSVASTEVPLLLPTLSVGDLQGSMQLRGQQLCVPTVPVSAPSAHANLIEQLAVVALINEETMSHGEYAATVLKAVRPDIRFFGAPTTGSLGSVTNIPLPGGILVGFTAMGILTADGADIQTRGIQPDVLVLEKPESVLIGRDDIMEEAIAFLKTPASR